MTADGRGEVGTEETRWHRCFTCRDYATSRRIVLAEPLTDKAIREKRDVVEVVDEFMLAAHDRHLASGAPLREGGPTGVLDPMLGRLAALMASITPPTTDETRTP